MGKYSAPVKHTCPDIDKCIDIIKKQMKECNYIQKNLSNPENEEFISITNNIEWEIDKIIPILEDLRKSNDELRSWGNEMVEKVVELEEEIANLS